MSHVALLAVIIMCCKVPTTSPLAVPRRYGTIMTTGRKQLQKYLGPDLNELQSTAADTAHQRYWSDEYQQRWWRARSCVVGGIFSPAAAAAAAAVGGIGIQVSVRCRFCQVEPPRLHYRWRWGPA